MNTLFKWSVKRKVNNLVPSSLSNEQTTGPSPSEVLTDTGNSIKDSCQSAYQKAKNSLSWIGRRNQCANRWCQEQKEKSSDYCKYHKCRHIGCNRPRDRRRESPEKPRNCLYCSYHHT